MSVEDTNTSYNRKAKWDRSLYDRQCMIKWEKVNQGG